MRASQGRNYWLELFPEVEKTNDKGEISGSGGRKDAFNWQLGFQIFCGSAAAPSPLSPKQPVPRVRTLSRTIISSLYHPESSLGNAYWLTQSDGRSQWSYCSHKIGTFEFPKMPFRLFMALSISNRPRCVLSAWVFRSRGTQGGPAICKPTRQRKTSELLKAERYTPRARIETWIFCSVLFLYSRRNTLQKQHRKSAKLPWRHTVKLSFWSLSFCLYLFAFLSFCHVVFSYFGRFVILPFLSCCFFAVFFCNFDPLSFCIFGLFFVILSRYHADQMSEGSQVSKVLNSKVAVTHWLTKVRYRAARAAENTQPWLWQSCVHKSVIAHQSTIATL